MYKEDTKKEVVKSVPNSDNSGVMRNKYGTGIRSYLVNTGLDDAKIDYKDGMVTYNGKPVIQPNVVVDGRSYADEDSLAGLALDLHKSEGNDLVSATDYAASKTGIKSAATVDNGYVSLGDTTLKATVATDGMAYLPRKTMDELLKRYISTTGYKSENEMFDEWMAGDGAKVKKALTDILEDEWSYSLEDDPAYQAYADMYKREGKRAFSDAFGNAIAGTDGHINSMAITAASSGLDNYMQKLSDKVPELMQADFERFNITQEKRLKAVDELLGIFDKKYSANSDYLNRISDANIHNYNQKVDANKAALDERVIKSNLFKSYIDAEKALTDLFYLPQVYESDLSGEKIEQDIDKTELEYIPLLYGSKLNGEALKQALDELELYYLPQLYESDIAGSNKENNLLDLEAKYYVGQHIK